MGSKKKRSGGNSYNDHRKRSCANPFSQRRSSVHQFLSWFYPFLPLDLFVPSSLLHLLRFPYFLFSTSFFTFLTLSFQSLCGGFDKIRLFHEEGLSVSLSLFSSLSFSFFLSSSASFRISIWIFYSLGLLRYSRLTKLARGKSAVVREKPSGKFSRFSAIFVPEESKGRAISSQAPQAPSLILLPHSYFFLSVSLSLSHWLFSVASRLFLVALLPTTNRLKIHPISELRQPSYIFH